VKEIDGQMNTGTVDYTKFQTQTPKEESRIIKKSNFAPATPKEKQAANAKA